MKTSCRAEQASWNQGKNITIDYRFAEQKNERLPELARTWFVLRLI